MTRMKRWIAACRTGVLLGCGLLLTLPAIAQDVQPNFPVELDKKLAARASDVNEVTMNKTMLKFASQFLDSKDKDDAQAQRLIQNLNAIYVRSYEFSQPGQYTPEDLQTIRRQFLGPDWNPMVKVRSKKGEGDTDVYVKMVGNEVKGMFVLDAEPKELDMVYISGSIRPEDLKELSGSFGVPNLNLQKSPTKESK
ncbi:MAG TPA: DUF4252 domain-containing protein [Acidobacteriaceae bacterium]|nr:DUF4252 domain-containing protein [Acidobacteriaceae bacterium]